jgi:hypothetical protein
LDVRHEGRIDAGGVQKDVTFKTATINWTTSSMPRARDEPEREESRVDYTKLGNTGMERVPNLSWLHGLRRTQNAGCSTKKAVDR